MDLKQFDAQFRRLIVEFGPPHVDEKLSKDFKTALFDTVGTWGPELFGRVISQLIKFHKADRFHRFPQTADFYRTMEDLYRGTDTVSQKPVKQSMEERTMREIDAGISKLSKKERTALRERAKEGALAEIRAHLGEDCFAGTDIDPEGSFDTYRLNAGTGFKHRQRGTGLEHMRFPLAHVLLHAGIMAHMRQLFEAQGSE